MGSVNRLFFLFLFADANTSLPSKMGGIAFVVLRRICVSFLLMAFNKASDKPNELNDINGVYEANFIFICFYNCKGTANFFDVVLIKLLCFKFVFCISA
jgi:hypothetical protein